MRSNVDNRYSCDDSLCSQQCVERQKKGENAFALLLLARRQAASVDRAGMQRDNNGAVFSFYLSVGTY